MDCGNTGHIEIHCLPDRKRRGKLLEKWVRIPGTGSVFQYGKCYLQVTSILGSNYPQELVVMKW